MIVNRTLDGFNTKSFREFCRIAIKQQDRDTRHACFDIVVKRTDNDEDSRNHMAMSVFNCDKGLDL